jgi:hypothetical protein
MTAMFVIGGYALVMLAFARRIYNALREDEIMAPDDSFDAAMTASMSLLISIFWPLVIPVAVIMWHPKPTAAETREALYERETENRDLQRRIDQLERELGIGAS